jgi:hypothetical protein
LHFQRKIWKWHNRNVLHWAFYCVNDGKDVEWGSLQIMRCIHCYISLVNNINPNIKIIIMSNNIL